MKLEIKNKNTGEILVTGEGENENLAILDAVKNSFSEETQSANLENANLKNANLESANLKNANLESANLESANLESANLKNANLDFANLYRANLDFANLESANLESANLKNANLDFANLYRANLDFANLESANLESANLVHVDSRNIRLDEDKEILFRMDCCVWPITIWHNKVHIGCKEFEFSEILEMTEEKAESINEGAGKRWKRFGNTLKTAILDIQSSGI